MRKKIALIVILIVCMSVMLLAACESVEKYTINLETNGGLPIKSIAFKSNVKTLQLPNATRDGYTFHGWFFDDETFNDKVTLPKLLKKLSSESKTITIYAQWEWDIGLDDAKEMLMEALGKLFLNVRGYSKAQDLNAVDWERVDYIEKTFEISDTNLDDRYKAILGILDEFLNYRQFGDAIKALDNVKEGDCLVIDDLSKSHIKIIEDLAIRHGLPRDFTEDNYLELYTEFQLLQNNYGGHHLEKDDLDMLNEYIRLIDRHYFYNYSSDAYNDSQNIIHTILDTFHERDIRASKLAQIALFLNDYDYDEMMYEEGGYWYPKPDKLVELLLSIIEHGNLIADEIGLISYNTLEYILSYTIDNINEEFSILEDKIIEESNEHKRQAYQEEKDRLEEMTQMLNDVNQELTVEMMIDLSDAFLKFAYIVNNNDLISQIFSMSSDIDAPTIAELVVFIESIQQAMLEISLSDSAAVWNNILDIIEGFESIIQDYDNQGIYSTYVKPFLFKGYNPFDIAGKVSDILETIDSDTLSIFLEEGTNVENRRVLKLKIDEYFFDNLAILEARLIVAFLGEDVDFEKIQEFYDNLYESIISLEIKEESIAQIYPMLISILYDIMQNKIVINESRYNKLVELASEPYAVQEHISEELLDASIIIRFVDYQMTASNMVKELMIKLGIKYPKNEFSLTAVLYLADISLSQISKMNELIKTYESTEPMQFRIRFVYDILDKGIMTHDQIETLLTRYGGYILQAWEQILGNEGIMDEEIVLAIQSIYESEEVIADFVDFLLRLLGKMPQEDGDIDYEFLLGELEESLEEIEGDYASEEEFVIVLKAVLDMIRDNL